VADDHDRLTLLFDVRQHVLDCVRANRQFVRETVIADEVMMAADLGFRATAGASLIVFASRKVDATLLRAFHYSLR
jgi:hypothetical protein